MPISCYFRRRKAMNLHHVSARRVKFSDRPARVFVRPNIISDARNSNNPAGHIGFSSSHRRSKLKIAARSSDVQTAKKHSPVTHSLVHDLVVVVSVPRRSSEAVWCRGTTVVYAAVGVRTTTGDATVQAIKWIRRDLQWRRCRSRETSR